MPTLDEAIAAIKAGDKETGRELLANLLQVDYNNEKAWLWLSSVVESDERRRQCLKRVLEINPHNQAAQRGLARLAQKEGSQETSAPAHSEPAGPLLSRIGPKDPEAELQSSLASLQQKRTSRPEPAESAPPPAQEAHPAQPESPPSKLAATGQPEQIEAPWLAEYSRAREDAPAAELAGAAGEPVPPVPDPAINWGVLAGTEAAQTIPRFAPAPEETRQPVLNQLSEYWQTRQGKLVLAGGLGGLLLACLACAVMGLIFQPSGEPTAAVAADTPIPSPTSTPTGAATPASDLPPTFTPTPGPTLTASATPTRVVADTPTVTPTPSRAPTADPNFQAGPVVGIVAGDVIDVVIDGVERRVKYILINAPAVNDPVRGTEPFGPEALVANRQLVEGQTVTLEADRQDADEFGRLLRYVYVGDLMVNEALLRQGLARVELIPPNLKYAARFQEVEREAQARSAGLWSLAETPKPARLVIVAVNDVEEYVDIQNQGDQPQDLAGWRLVSERGGEACNLAGLIEPGATLRVRALLADQGQGGFNCGFTQNIWLNAEPDPAVLFDPTGREVSRGD